MRAVDHHTKTTGSYIIMAHHVLQFPLMDPDVYL